MDAAEASERAAALTTALGRVIVGQEPVLEQAVAALIAGGHVLLEGAPGTAKTLLVRALAVATSGRFSRLQFTPDLMPSDITGVNVYRQSRDAFEFMPGPIFCDLLLGDEINRAPAKTQAALLEAMHERQVTVDGENHALPAAFTVFATQNPVEYEGTYPLPEAQLDRFLFKTVVSYPAHDEEERILRLHQGGFDAARPETFGLAPVMGIDDLAAVRALIRALPVADPVLTYVVSIVRATREHPLFTLGASPRASVMLLAGAKALAVVRGRGFVTPDDVRDAAFPVLRHRVVLTAEAEVEGMTADQALRQVLDRVEVPR